MAFSLFLSEAVAQNTGGVFGPVVSPGHAATQYRITTDPDRDVFAHRLHVEQSVSTRIMWRVVAQNRGTSIADQQFDFVQGELFTQFTDDTARFQHGMRADIRLRENGRPSFIALNYMTEFELVKNLQFRAVVLSTREFGDHARDGIVLETRNHLSWRVRNGARFGVETYNVYGSTADKFVSGKHQAGPFASLPLSRQWSVYAGALFGLSERAPDTNIRFWINLNF